ncbi:hypothetical protein GUJ93_ZPchr0012g19719 [Zizania palustris]|uniref:Uncharacterized protein n=1 Tax=Zizania palustris TaxID=103762 RepID=A0A8J6BT48_ZIZPA|nr:hypothetical protein GUJ93_ZPchr0012g19719 [Zizania palustris]
MLRLASMLPSMLQGSVVKSKKKSSWVGSEGQEEELMGGALTSKKWLPDSALEKQPAAQDHRFLHTHAGTASLSSPADILPSSSAPPLAPPGAEQPEISKQETKGENSEENRSSKASNQTRTTNNFDILVQV